MNDIENLDDWVEEIRPKVIWKNNNISIELAGDIFRIRSFIDQERFIYINGNDLQEISEDLSVIIRRDQSIAPCPNCKMEADGGAGIYIEANHYDDSLLNVVCDNCYMQGPAEKSELNAIKVWNSLVKKEL